VIVAARAADGESEKTAADDVDTVVTLVRARDFNGAVVVEPRTLPKKTQAGKHSDAVFFVHEIGGQLRFHKLVVRKIVIEGAHDPVAVNERVFVRRVAATHGVETAIIVFAKSGDVQPKASPSFTVVWRFQ